MYKPYKKRKSGSKKDKKSKNKRKMYKMLLHKRRLMPEEIRKFR